jgi:putative Ca2+/H+ antiporter (TMEM165/GDT1 family)
MDFAAQGFREAEASSAAPVRRGDRLAPPLTTRAPRTVATFRHQPLPALEALLVSTGIVAIAEIGDKTQLLSLVLAARFRRPLPILLGILLATLLNHGIAGALGAWIRSLLAPDTLRWLLALSFFAMGAWALRPDRPDERMRFGERYGVFVVTLVAFFLVEIGDKTQVATIALAARYDALVAVVLGTTAGMLFANAPVVLLADRVAAGVPYRLIRFFAAALFVLTGGLTVAT